ncbi:hypothetical protein JW906_12160 [bacterium]|nr:hypothetical protein [bacterium]
MVHLCWFVPNLLLQKFPSPSFTATAKISFQPDRRYEKAGLYVPFSYKWSVSVPVELPP